MKKIIKLIASGFYLGYSPIAPGTIGSILGVLVFIRLYSFPTAYVLVTLSLLILGFLIAGRAESLYGEKDSGKIVIDEIAGMCIVYLGMPYKLWIIIAGFLIYRVFDIFKPQPIKRIEKISGSAGIMLDDVLAAVYANLILQVLIRLPL